MNRPSLLFIMPETRTDPKEGKVKELIRRELERKANDQIRVYNPTTEDFEVSWDTFLFNVPGKDKDAGYGPGMSVLPRYIALNYIKHMTDKILTKRADDHIGEINKKRKDQGQPALNPQEREIEETPYRTDNADSRKEIIVQLWKGVEREYGIETAPARKEVARDSRPIEEQVVEEIESGRATTTTTEAPTEVLDTLGEKAKDEQLEEVAE